MVHDTVAQKNFDPVLPPLPDHIAEDFDEESVKIVRLVKNKEPLVCGPILSFPPSSSFPPHHPPRQVGRDPARVFRVSDALTKLPLVPVACLCAQYPSFLPPP